MPRQIIALVALLLAWLLLPSCVCYRSFIEADFHDHNYTNSGSHREINAWWTEGEGFQSSANPAFMVDARKTEGGEVRIGFIRSLGADDKVYIKNMFMTDKHANSVPTNAPSPIFSIPIQKKQFPLFKDHGDGIDVWRGYAEIQFTPRVSISRSPYRISLNGYYLRSNGSKEIIQSTIIMDMKRTRKITNIADCWP